MADMNIVFVSGRLAADCKIMRTRGGYMSIKGTVAHGRYLKTDSGFKEETSFIDFVCFKSEARQEDFLKGMNIAMQGYIKQDKWTDNATGASKSKVLIMAEKIDCYKREKKERAESFSAAYNDANDNNIPF